MRISLVSNAAEPKAVAVQHDAAPPPQMLQKGTPRRLNAPMQRQIANKAAAQQPKKITEAKPRAISAPPTPIITNNTAAVNTIPVPQQTPVPASPAKQDAVSGNQQSASNLPPIPATSGSPGGNAGQGGTADVPAPVPVKPAFDMDGFRRTYAASAKAKVQRAQFFPDAARDPQNSGTVVHVRAKFRIARDGSVSGVSTSSENEVLSQAAEAAVRRAAPFAAFPDEVTLNALSVSITLDYKLR